MMSLSQVCSAVQGRLQQAPQGSSTVMLQNVSINTRADCRGRLFVALKGDNFDAHDYIQQAQEAGAAAIMVERDVDSPLPVVRVASTHQALKDLAAWWRLQFAIPVLAITGSVGKTTVKEMLGAITSELGQGVVTHGNLNNEIGVPLTLMRLTAQDRYAVVEMGMNQAGEVGRLSAISRPTVAVVNNAGAAHLEGLGTIEAVAKAKGEIFSGLAHDGVAIINADDPFAELWSELVVDKNTMTFGLSSEANVTASYEEQGSRLLLKVRTKGVEKKGQKASNSVEIQLNSVGEHSVRNALAAIAAALAANIPMSIIVRGLENYQPIKGRLNLIKAGGLTVFDDTYNANPTSMQAAIKVLANHDKNLLIVGDMAELGDSCEKEHLVLGRFAATHGIDQLLACGQYAQLVVKGFDRHGVSFDSQEGLLDYLAVHDLNASAILVKGSRSAQMENVVAALVDRYSKQEDSKKKVSMSHASTQEKEQHIVGRGVTTQRGR